MSISLSIFQKPCPGCAASVAIGLARCDCGHIFESTADSLSPLEATLRDEELYEGYLAARAEQAHQAARTAQENLAEDKSNSELISVCALAREVAKSIDNDLAEQQNKIVAIRNTLRQLTPAASIPSPVATISSTATEKSTPRHSSVAPSVPKRPAVTAAETLVPTVFEKTTPVAAPTASTQKVAQQPVPHMSLAPTAVPTQPTAPAPVATARAILVETTPVAAPAKPASASVWRATTTEKAAGVLAALKNAKARESVARAQQAEAAAEMKQTSAPASTSAHGAAPPTAFRKEQASRAEKIMEARKTIDGKECPNCTSTVPVNTTRCQCGFAFVSGGTDLPTLTLCTGDFTALRNSLKLNLR